VILVQPFSMDAHAFEIDGHEGVEKFDIIVKGSNPHAGNYTLIDPQVDFCNNGTLCVGRALSDAKRLTAMLDGMERPRPPRQIPIPGSPASLRRPHALGGIEPSP